MRMKTSDFLKVSVKQKVAFRIKVLYKKTNFLFYKYL